MGLSINKKPKNLETSEGKDCEKNYRRIDRYGIYGTDSYFRSIKHENH
jgi:hypothetical protein